MEEGERGGKHTSSESILLRLATRWGVIRRHTVRADLNGSVTLLLAGEERVLAVAAGLVELGGGTTGCEAAVAVEGVACAAAGCGCGAGIAGCYLVF